MSHRQNLWSKEYSNNPNVQGLGDLPDPSSASTTNALSAALITCPATDLAQQIVCPHTVHGASPYGTFQIAFFT